MLIELKKDLIYNDDLPPWQVDSFYISYVQQVVHLCTADPMLSPFQDITRGPRGYPQRS